MKIRRPCQAGAFYPASKDELVKSIEDCFLTSLGPGRKPSVNIDGKREVKGIVSPHAGYIYSGPIAAHSYTALAEDGKPDLAVLIGPNHTGVGSGVSLMSEGVWETPLGRLEIDKAAAERISASSDIIDIDELAHTYEHSIEVQLPFIRYFKKDFAFVPILVSRARIDVYKELGKEIAGSIKDYGKEVVIIASSDMTHYEEHESAKKKDTLAIEAILNLDEDLLLKRVAQYDISMCG